MNGRFSTIFSDRGSEADKTTLKGSAGTFDSIFADRPKPKPDTTPPAAVSAFPGTTQTLSELQIDPLSLKADPHKAINDAWDTIKTSVLREGDNLNGLISSLDSKKSAAERIGAGLKTVAGAASVALSPLSALFSLANDVPVIGTISRLITLPFQAAGEGAIQISNKIVDELPISQEAKDKIKPGLGEISALGAQLALGKVTDVAAKKGLPSERAAETFRSEFSKENPQYAEDVKKIGTNRLNKIVQEHGPEDARTIIKQAIDLSREKQGLEPYNPLQVNIQERPAAQPSATTEPIGQFDAIFGDRQGEVPNDKFVFNMEQLKNDLGVNETAPKQEQVLDPNTTPPFLNSPKPNEVVDGGAPVVEKPVIEPVEGTGPSRVSGLAKGVEAKAIENKLTQGFGELPEYQSVSMKDQAERAARLISEDADRARRIAMGQEAPPSDLLPESVFVAIEDRAIKQGDVATLRDLATRSSLTSEATTMGQRIRTLAERDPESPVGAMKEIQRAREEAAIRKTKTKDISQAKRTVADEIKQEIKKSAPTRQSWNEFVSSLRC